MADGELPQSRLRVGGWLPPGPPTRPDGERRSAHRGGAPAIGPPPSRRTAAAPVPGRQHRLLLVTGAVAAVLAAGSAVAAVRPDDPPALVVSVGARQPALPPVGTAQWPAFSDPPVDSTLTPPPERSGGPTRSPGVTDRAGRSSAAVPRAGRGAAAEPSATAGPRDAAPLLAVGRTVSLAPASRPGERLRHSGSSVRVDPLSPTNSAAVRADADFVVRAGPADARCVSFESAEQPGRFLRRRAAAVLLQAADGSDPFGRDATFCPVTAGGGIALRSAGDPGRFLAAAGSRVVLAPADRPTASMIFLTRPPL